MPYQIKGFPDASVCSAERAESCRSKCSLTRSSCRWTKRKAQTIDPITQTARRFQKCLAIPISIVAVLARRTRLRCDRGVLTSTMIRTAVASGGRNRLSWERALWKYYLQLYVYLYYLLLLCVVVMVIIIAERGTYSSTVLEIFHLRFRMTSRLIELSPEL